MRNYMSLWSEVQILFRAFDGNVALKVWQVVAIIM